MQKLCEHVRGFVAAVLCLACICFHLVARNCTVLHLLCETLACKKRQTALPDW